MPSDPFRNGFYWICGPLGCKCGLSPGWSSTIFFFPYSLQFLCPPACLKVSQIRSCPSCGRTFFFQVPSTPFFPFTCYRTDSPLPNSLRTLYLPPPLFFLDLESYVFLFHWCFILPYYRSPAPLTNWFVFTFPPHHQVPTEVPRGTLTQFRAAPPLSSLY